MINNGLWGFIVFVGCVCAACLYIFIDRRYRRKTDARVPVTADTAKDTIQLVREWTTWMAGIHIATFAGLSVLTQGGLKNDYEKIMSCLTVIFLGASLFAAAWVLSALPFLRMNLTPGPHPHEDNDVYEQDLYRFIPVRFGGAGSSAYLLDIGNSVIRDSVISENNYSQH